MGTMNRSVVHPREIFKYAYLNSASSIVCVHNHPSGAVKPSVEDIQFTESMVRLGKLNAIPMVDHVIVGDTSYYSFYEDGKILNLQENFMRKRKKSMFHKNKKYPVL